MTNSTKRDYKIKHTELFGGDVHLQQIGHRSTDYAACYRCAEACCCCSAPGLAPTIKSEGELAGLYFYSIDQSFVLVQQSTFSLPFVKPEIKLEKYLSIENYFQEQTQKGKFQRKYRIESDKFLPKGIVTIREDGRVVGQAHLCDISQGDKQDLDCGEDSDVYYVRDVKVLEQKRQSASYQIRLTIVNAKNKSIKFQYKELISSAKFTIKPKNDNQQVNEQIQILDDGIKIIQNDLKPNDKAIFIYEILLEYKIPEESCQYQQQYK